MKVSDKLAQREKGEVSYSFEYFCPKTEQGVFNLIDRIDRMAKLDPLFLDITWNAGGSSSAHTTLELIEVCEKELQVDTCMHMTCAGMTEAEVDQALQSAYDAGCRTVLALRGDPPKTRPDDQHENRCGFNYAKDLIRHIRQKFGDKMSIGIAGYPEGHTDEGDQKLLLQYLQEKVDAGADFVVTQMFYDVDLFVQWWQAVRDAGITIPIVPGIMPVSGWASFLRRAKWCQINLPPKWTTELEPLSHDDAAVRQRGTELVAELCRELMTRTDIDHLHFYTMNLEKSPVMCLEALDLPPKNARCAVKDDDQKSTNEIVANVGTVHSRLRRKSTLSSVKPIHWRNRPNSYSHRTAQWDEFPNGRWGDSRSPAFNSLNELEALLKVSSASARKLWGHPESAADVGRVVQQYLQGEIMSLPWSDSPAAGEVQAISQELLAVNNGEHEWFSVNSQPAVNGIPSGDQVFGWGPAHGYVYQKAYIELLVSPELYARIQPKLQQLQSSAATYYAVGASPDAQLETNGGVDDVNAITWGIFPGKEVVQPTIVEGASFLAWKEEAFRIALEWGRCYPVDSTPHQFLQQMANKWVLVNILYHDYHNPHGLFNVISELTQ